MIYTEGPLPYSLLHAVFLKHSYLRDHVCLEKNNNSNNIVAGWIIYWRESRQITETDTVLTRIEIEHPSRTKVFSLPAPLLLPFLGFFFYMDQIQSSQISLKTL